MVNYGSCLCKSVKYSFRNEPEVGANCHCNYCKKSSGAPFVTWLVVLDRNLVGIEGENSLIWHSSSIESKRAFCNACGSLLFFRSNLCGDEYHITYSSLDTKLDLNPKFNCFVDQKAHWIKVDEDLVSLTSESDELKHYQTIKSIK